MPKVLSTSRPLGGEMMHLPSLMMKSLTEILHIQLCREDFGNHGRSNAKNFGNEMKKIWRMEIRCLMHGSCDVIK